MLPLYRSIKSNTSPQHLMELYDILMLDSAGKYADIITVTANDIDHARELGKEFLEQSPLLYKGWKISKIQKA